MATCSSPTTCRRRWWWCAGRLPARWARRARRQGRERAGFSSGSATRSWRALAIGTHGSSSANTAPSGCRARMGRGSARCASSSSTMAARRTAACCIQGADSLCHTGGGSLCPPARRATTLCIRGCSPTRSQAAAPCRHTPRHRMWSTADEFVLDLASGAVEQVWSFGPPVDHLVASAAQPRWRQRPISLRGFSDGSWRASTPGSIAWAPA